MFFGPFGHQLQFGVVATFSHKMARNETPIIDVDGDLKLIYVELIGRRNFKRNSGERS
jgi:hypothetical protein